MILKSLESKYREQLKKNEADSYSAYVSKQGIRADEQYADALDKASLKKILADTNYGALAERLRKTGLNASGYEDYVRSENAKDHTSAVNTAKEKRAVGEHLNRSGYKSYLSDYEKRQTTLSESLIKKLKTDGVYDLEKAYEEAVNLGISKSLAYVTAKAGVEEATKSTTIKAIGFAMDNSLSATEAEEYAISLGLPTESVEFVYDAIVNIDTEDFFADLSATDYYNYIKLQNQK